MNYKSFIKSRQIRWKILELLNFVPDKQMISIQYFIKCNRLLNLKAPQRFTEKLQWYKLYYRDPLMQLCSDKYEVREYVKNKGLNDILIPIIGIYDKIEDIQIDNLPQQFVAKDTLGAGGTSVIICKDKKTLNYEVFKKQLSLWLNTSSTLKSYGREWVYEGKTHRIIIEDYLQNDPTQGGLIDYKFFCFNGKCAYVYVIADRIIGKQAALGIYTRDFKKLDVYRADEAPLTRCITKPSNYKILVEIAEALSSPFPEARIDLYDIENKIYFGEITFFDGSGYMKFEPDQFDFDLGSRFILPESEAT